MSNIVVSVTFCAFVINCSYLFANDSYLFAINLYCEQLIANAHKVTDTTLYHGLKTNWNSALPRSNYSSNRDITDI